MDDGIRDSGRELTILLLTPRPDQNNKKLRTWKSAWLI
jgi:hypothetical protein